MSRSYNVVTLYSISGKSVTLPFPVTYQAVFDAATAPPFSFSPESAKICVHNRPVKLQTYMQLNSSRNANALVDASAYTTAESRGAVRGAAAAPSPSPSTVTAPATSGVNGSRTALPALAAPRPPSATRSLIIYGVPRRVQALLPRAPGHGAAAVPPLSSQAVAAAAAAATHRPNAAAAASAALSPSSAPTPPAVTQPRNPLPYPHCPDGLRELSAAVSASAGDADDDDDLISLLQGAPQRVYSHPTMRYIANKVRGNLETLRAVMEQISRAAPPFYAWIEANPQKFLSALNRVGERSLQQVREQLRLLALQAVAGQMNGDGPSRQVMMLEVNTRDGAPDVYQVEVQVGDFSSSSESSGDTSMAYDSADEAEEEEEDDDEYFEGEGDGDGDGGYDVGISGGADSERDVGSSYRCDGESCSGAAREGSHDWSEMDGSEEPHRGAIRLSPTAAAATAPRTPPPSSHHQPQQQQQAGSGDAQPLAAGGSVSRSLEPLAPAPPAGPAPVRSGRPAPLSRSPRGPSASLGGSPAAATTSAPAQAESAAVEESQGEDEFLVRLRAEAHAVEALRQEATRSSDSAATRRVHDAITALRPKFFAAVAEVCVSLSTAASAAAHILDDGGQACTAPPPPPQLLLLRRLVRCACDFFVSAEEFYAALDEEGRRASVFGPSPLESLAAWAAVAALSRLLLCDVDAAMHAAVAAHGHGVASASGAAGPRRVGALRSMQSDHWLWSHPALHWAFGKGPEALLASLLQLCRQQRAVFVWYSSHYLVKAVGKTIQTMAYVVGGREEAQQPVSLRRLKMTSRAHKVDEVAECVAALAAAAAEASGDGAVADGVRRQWLTLMRSRYQQLVRPLEGDLPTPHMSSNTLYLCDTRHVLPQKESAPEETARPGPDGAVRWWAGYCDDRSTLCADKWCLAATLRPWGAAMAAANAQEGSGAARVAVVVGDSPDQGTPSSPTPLESALALRGLLSVETMERAADPAAPVRRAAVLYERAVTPSASGGAMAVRESTPPPPVVGDLHIVDALPQSFSASTALTSPSLPATSLCTPLSRCVDAHTQLATVVRNFSFPAAMARSTFLRRLLDTIAAHPAMPAAAAARQAALASASAADAPWLVCEYLLLDYGGPIGSLAAPAPAPGSHPHTTSSHSKAAASGGERAEDFVLMPSVPLGRRLSEPRPVSALGRRRSNSQSDSDSRSTRHPGAAAGGGEDAAKRQYARSHAIDALYEMMLGSLLEQQPTGEAAVLEHLVSFLETSEEAMQETVRRRQADVTAAAAAAAAGAAAGTVDGAAGAVALVNAASRAAPSSSGVSPQPPTKKRTSNSRPSFSRRKPFQ